MKQCPRCRQYVDDYSRFCSHCGQDLTGSTSTGATPPPYDGDRPSSYYTDGRRDEYGRGYYTADNPFDVCGPEGRSRGVTALLAIFLGSLGVQYFYLGKTTGGIISIILGFVSCGLWSIVTILQGILMFCMSNETFRRKYLLTSSEFPVF